MFVIDGSQALRQAIDAVFGANNPVQRCRNHQVEKVRGHLPEDLKDQVKAVMKAACGRQRPAACGRQRPAAYRLDAEQGMARLRHQARWLEGEYPSAAASLREGLAETFTLNRLGLPPTLRRCLATTNLIESPSGAESVRLSCGRRRPHAEALRTRSPHSGVRLRPRRVTNWKHGNMVLRWAAAPHLETEQRFRKILGYRDLWILPAALHERSEGQEQVMAA